jgi:hypothetical protein
MRRPGSRLRFAMVALFVAAALATSVVPAFATTVVQLVFSPVPIGTINTVAAGTNTSVILTALDSTHTPVRSVAVWVSFVQAPGGGTAFVGTTGLNSRVQPFITDTNGRVNITYSTPATYPSPNTDVDFIHAQNSTTRLTSTAIAATSFSFSPITALVFTPTPIARQGSLGPNHSVTITLTVFGKGGLRMADGSVELSFKQGLGGGTAAANGVSLNENPGLFKTNAAGQVFITFMTPAILPTLVADKLIASDAVKFGAITTKDAYRY